MAFSLAGRFAQWQAKTPYYAAGMKKDHICQADKCGLFRAKDYLNGAELR